MKDCIIEALANPEKEKMKHDDATISSWLHSKYFYFSEDEIFICRDYHSMYSITCTKDLLVKSSLEHLAT